MTWSPIATAPKDGTPIVAIGICVHRPAVICACITRWSCDRVHGPEDGWYFVAPGWSDAFVPTHWLPLPDSGEGE